jgi:mannose-1-phosphate guanylyltransferase
MQIILLSGGSGKRLWPLSNADRPKQFLKILPSPDGTMESMVQRVYRQIREAGITDPITIATGALQVPLIREQLGLDVEVVQEPSRRDTFPAIALVCAYLRYEKSVSLSDTVAVMPIDPYCELGYFEAVRQMSLAAHSNFADIMLMGIKPTEPSEKYGYIVPDSVASGIPLNVRRFVEKPDRLAAEKLIADGAMWNGGVFVFQLRYMAEYIQREFEIASYQDALDRYNSFTKTSFDYAVVEKAKFVGMVSYSGFWEDLGTWGALVDKLESPLIGNAASGEGTRDTQIINELNIPIIALGVKDLVIVASKEGILITGRQESSSLKEYVDKVG